MKSGVYLIQNVINHKIYIGSSRNVYNRKSSHFCRLSKGNHANPYLQNAWNKYGKSAFHFEIVEFCLVKELAVREEWWILLLRTDNRLYGYNLKGARTYNHSDETRAKISANSVGMTGKTHSEETRQRISNTLRGRKHSDSTKERMRLAREGQQISEETKAKISQNNKSSTPEVRAKIALSKKGKPWSDARRAAHNKMR